jgi:hypothetical protein
MGVACPCPITKAIFGAIAEATLGLSAAEIIEESSGSCTVAEAAASGARWIRLKTRTMDSTASWSIFLFFIVTSDYLSCEN